MEAVPLLSTSKSDDVQISTRINLDKISKMNQTHNSNNCCSTSCCVYFLTNLNVRRCVSMLIILTILSILYYTHLMDDSPISK